MVFALAIVLANAHVVTMDPSRPEARVVAIVGERIAYVGDDVKAARKAAGPGAEVVDVGGRALLPGFNDAHVHFGLSLTLGSEQGVTIQAADRAAWMEALGRASRARPEGWLYVTTRELPAGVGKKELDAVDRPIMVVTARGGHLNRAALAVGRFTAEEAEGGFIRGRELAAALERLAQALPPERLRGEARAFLARLARLGVTSVQLIDELPAPFEALRQEGELTARVRQVSLGHRFETPFHEPRWPAVAPSWLRVDGVKYFHDDGARLPRFELEHVFRRAAEVGQRVVVHVLSRRALDTLLDGLEALGRASGHPDAIRLFRVDHADEVTPEQAARLARLGLVVCANPSMLPEWRKERAFPLRTLLDAGVRLCIGSDWVGRHEPERPIDPLRGVAMALTHGGFGTRERISASEALLAYTAGSAAGEGEDQEKGTLAPGRLADLIVLSGDPSVLAPEDLERAEVLLTVVGGRVVHRAGVFALPTSRLPGPTIGTPPAAGPPTIGPPPAPRPPALGPAPRRQ